MSIKIVKAARVSRRYGTIQALEEVDFEIQGPGLIGILGPNGAGKTSLLDVLEGLSEPTQGSVSLFDTRVSLRDYPRERVGVVLQREFAPDHMTVAEYAELFAALHGVSRGAERILERAALEARARVRVARLSGGEAQRLFIAAALVHEPELVFLDEPTAELDPEHKRRIGTLLLELAKTRTVVITTHDLSEANELCDYCLFLVGGRVRASGTRAELIAAAPGGTNLEDAFFHFCATRVTSSGEPA